MKSWISWKAFVGAAVCMALLQWAKLAKEGGGEGALIEAILAIVLGGLFWGVIASYIHSRFCKK